MAAGPAPRFAVDDDDLIYVYEDEDDKPVAGPAPLFRGVPIVMDFDPSVGDVRIVLADLTVFALRLQAAGGSEDEFVEAVPAFVAEYGLAARLVGRTSEAIEFAVTQQ